MKTEKFVPEVTGEGLTLGPLVRGREYARQARDLLRKIREEQLSANPGPCRMHYWKILHAATKAEDLFIRASAGLSEWTNPDTRMRASVLKMECAELLEQAIILEREVRDNAHAWRTPAGAWKNGSLASAPAA